MKKTKQIAPKKAPKKKSNLGPPWKPGESGNPKGRKKGKKNFETDFKMACQEVAKALRLGKDPDKVKIELIKRGIREGITGKYPFWEDLMNRLYGKTKESIEMEHKGKVIILDE